MESPLSHALDQVALVGYRGVGKTTVGRAVANQLGWNFFDADSVLQHRAGCSIAEIFRTKGETSFRDLEAEILLDLLKEKNAVLSLGGGVVLREPNRLELKKSKAVIWLRASEDVLFQRIQADPNSGLQRPGLTSLGMREEIAELLRQRAPFYAEVATQTIDVDDKPPTTIAKQIVSLLTS